MIIEIDITTAILVVVLTTLIDTLLIYAIVWKDKCARRKIEEDLELLMLESDIDYLLRQNHA